MSVLSRGNCENSDHECELATIYQRGSDQRDFPKVLFCHNSKIEGQKIGFMLSGIRSPSSTDQRSIPEALLDMGIENLKTYLLVVESPGASNSPDASNNLVER